MTTVEAPRSAEGSRPVLPLSLRLAGRQMRAGFEGFIIFMLCVALGVMVIAAVGTLADSLTRGLERHGRTILGGDIALSRMHTRANERERAVLDSLAKVSETSTMRIMARLPDGSDQMLAELKSVDGAYSLVGSVELSGGMKLADALRDNGAAVEPILLERLGLKVGDSIEIGKAKINIRATIMKEPEGLADRLTYGPRIIVSLDTLQNTGLIQPGALVRWRYALALAGGEHDHDSLLRAREELKHALADAGFTIADRRDPSPQVRKTLDRLRQFLTLIGLAALIVGGVGIANAVAHYVDRRRRTIATMRAIGATGRQIFRAFLAQILLIAAIGNLLGLAAGILIPGVLQAQYGDLLPLPAEMTVSPASVVTAAVYGLIVALLFSVWPLGRAEQISPAVLFRDEVGGPGGWPNRRIVLATAGLAAALVAIVFASSDVTMLAVYFSGTLIVVLLVFYLLGHAVTWLARKIPRPRYPELSLAIGNLGAPGGLTRSIVLSLGAGLSLLVALALVDASLVEELNGKMPENAPDYFVLDIPKAEISRFRDSVLAQEPAAVVREAPMLRGRMVSLGNRPVEDIKAPPEAEWVLRGDRGITYAGEVPEGSRITAGEWWPPDYAGEPLVSFEAELAKQLGIGLGDTVTVNVLGRNITARIANLRELDWESLSINFVMVFSPNTFAGAPNNMLATIALPDSVDLAHEAGLAKAVAQEFPTATVIRVRDAITAFNGIFEKIIMAIRIASGMTLLAGALVLAGSLATAQRRRTLEAVILKALGATRQRILLAHVFEYLLLGLLTAGFAVALGSVAAWLVLGYIETRFTFSLLPVLQAIGIALGLILTLGGLGTWQVLRARPVPYLRSQ